MTIEGQGHFFTIYFPGFVCLCSTRPRYQVSVYRTIGPLVIPMSMINFTLSCVGQENISDNIKVRSIVASLRVGEYKNLT